MPRRWVAAAVLLPLLTVVSCSKDKGSDTLTKEEYIAAGDALCQRFLDETDAQPEPETPDDIAALLDELIPLAEEILDGFEALDPPSEADDVHEALRSSLEASTAKVKEARQALEDGDFDAFGSLMGEAVDLGDDSDQVAKDFGFQVCGSESELSTE